MRVVLYYDNSYVSVFILTAIDDLIKKGHQVYLLTTSPAGAIHERAQKLGAMVFDRPSRGLYHHCRILIAFCYRHKIHIVLSHLQYLNLVAVMSRFFIRASVFPMRHHADDVYLSGNKNAKRLDKLVNILSKKILVVSEVCKRQMVLHEGVKPRKIIVMTLYYDFNFYHTDDNNSRSLFSGDHESLQLISVGRMVKNKNHITLLRALKRLVNEGKGIKLTLLDTGPLEAELKDFVADAGLDKYVSFMGRRDDVMKCLTAADILVHPSISESFGQVVIEAGICHKPVIVVDGVGNFDEYIIHGQNGFLLSRANIERDLYETLTHIYHNRKILLQMGDDLKIAVSQKFKITPDTKTYASLLNDMVE